FAFQVVHRTSTLGVGLAIATVNLPNTDQCSVHPKLQMCCPICVFHHPYPGHPHSQFHYSQVSPVYSPVKRGTESQDIIEMPQNNLTFLRDGFRTQKAKA
ncbi:mCG1033931, partial [Mus musculus]